MAAPAAAVPGPDGRTELLQADSARIGGLQAFLRGRAAHGRPGWQIALTYIEGVPMMSFARDIAPLFRQEDVAAMKWMFDLADYDDVREHAEAILDVVE